MYLVETESTICVGECRSWHWTIGRESCFTLGVPSPGSARHEELTNLSRSACWLRTFMVQSVHTYCRVILRDILKTMFAKTSCAVMQRNFSFTLFSLKYFVFLFQWFSPKYRTNLLNQRTWSALSNENPKVKTNLIIGWWYCVIPSRQLLVVILVQRKFSISVFSYKYFVLLCQRFFSRYSTYLLNQPSWGALSHENPQVKTNTTIGGRYCVMPSRQCLLVIQRKFSIRIFSLKYFVLLRQWLFPEYRTYLLNKPTWTHF